MHIDQIKNSLSKKRLETYKKYTKSGSWDDAVTLYEWHSEVCAAFFLPIQIFEVVFRNSINKALVEKYSEIKRNNTGAPLPDAWFMHRGIWFSGDMKRELDSVVSEAEKKLKPRGRSVTVNVIIPELRFSFWEGFLVQAFQQLLWDKGFDVPFPHIDKPENESLIDRRHRIFNFVKDVREFRNRVAHHEPIFKYSLNAQISNLEKFVGWVCPKTSYWMEKNNESLRKIINSVPDVSTYKP